MPLPSGVELELLLKSKNKQKVSNLRTFEPSNHITGIQEALNQTLLRRSLHMNMKIQRFVAIKCSFRRRRIGDEKRKKKSEDGGSS